MPRPILPYVPWEELKAHLSLTDTQIAGLRKVAEASRTAESAIYEQMRERHQQLQQLLSQGTNDSVTVGRLMIEINTLQRQLPLPNTQYRTQALALLTDVQKAKLPALSEALKLSTAAYQAVELNLVERPVHAGGPPRILPASSMSSPSATLVGEAQN